MYDRAGVEEIWDQVEITLASALKIGRAWSLIHYATGSWETNGSLQWIWDQHAWTIKM